MIIKVENYFGRTYTLNMVYILAQLVFLLYLPEAVVRLL